MKIGAISLGCDKNRVDTERMLDRLIKAGHTVVGSEEEAEVLVINTCAFIESSKEESLGEIFAALSYAPDKKVVVTGCLGERYLDELVEEIPEIDCILGVRDYDRIAECIERIARGEKVRITDGKDRYHAGRVLTTPYHYAYVRIADGCDNRCTYCAIPSIRGRYVSERMEDIIEEAKSLADDGVKELILVAQDVTRYGIDIYGKPQLIELLRELEKTDAEWIRLLYLEPEMVTEELLDYIRDSKKVVKYADIPFQHVADGVLKRMGRKSTKADILRIMSMLRDRGIAARTSFICGFPGETEAEHEELIEFVKRERLDYAGFFAYSREDGTPADRLDGHLSKSIIEARTEAARAVQAEVIFAKNRQREGSVVKVIYDDIDYDRQMFAGRTQFQTPDIDTKIYFTAKKEMRIGEFYDVRITGSDGFDLLGEVVQ